MINTSEAADVRCDDETEAGNARVDITSANAEVAHRQVESITQEKKVTIRHAEVITEQVMTISEQENDPNAQAIVNTEQVEASIKQADAGKVETIGGRDAIRSQVEVHTIQVETTKNHAVQHDTMAERISEQSCERTSKHNRIESLSGDKDQAEATERTGN